MHSEILEFCIGGGHITLVTSPEIHEKDYEKILEAYSEESFKRDLEELLQDPVLREPTEMLCALIQNGKLDIHIALLRGEIYHHKKGYFEDDFGNIVAFDGSGTETLSAWAAR